MKNVVTMNESKKYLVQFSEEYVLDKNLWIDVPRGHTAIVYVDGRPLYKTQSKERVFDKCGRQNLKKTVQFAFYQTNANPEFNYGFGPIHVNNERLKEAYRIGINGQMVVKIDYQTLIRYYDVVNSITIEDIKDRLLPIIKSVGAPEVSKFFVNSTVSVFEITSKIGEIREAMAKGFEKEELLSRMGVEIVSLAVNEVFINPDDLEMIRNRINNNN